MRAWFSQNLMRIVVILIAFVAAGFTYVRRMDSFDARLQTVEQSIDDVRCMTIRMIAEHEDPLGCIE